MNVSFSALCRGEGVYIGRHSEVLKMPLIPPQSFYTAEISAQNVRCKCVVSAEHVLTRYGPRKFCVLIGQLNWEVQSKHGPRTC